MDKGWIKLHRQLTENKIWLSEPFTKGQAWVDLLLNANHKEGSLWVRGNEIKVKRGQIAWSEVTMAKRWGWSRNKVRRYLKWLESEQQVEQQKVFKITTIITIIRYNSYQSDTTERQQKDNRRNTNKNVKNVKNKSEQSSHDKNKEDMPWKQYNENKHSDDLPAIDLDGNPVDSDEEKMKKENVKKLRYKKDMVEWLITHHQKDRSRITQGWRNKQFKALEQLWVMHIPRPQIIETIIEYEEADWFKGKPDYMSIISKFEKQV